MSIFVWIILAIGAMAICIKLTSSLNDLVEFLGFIGALGFGFLAFILVVATFKAPLDYGDPVEIDNVVMRTNNLTCVTFTDFSGGVNHITSTEAWAYNAAPGTLKIMGQRKRNSWKYTMDPRYSLKHIEEKSNDND